MIKKLLILGAFCSLSFGGIEDDITKDKNFENKFESMEKYIESAYEECRKIQFDSHKADNMQYSLDELEQFYESADKLDSKIENLNQEFKSKVNHFLSTYTDSSERDNIESKFDDIVYKSKTGFCFPPVLGIERYKETIKKSYVATKKDKEKTKNEDEIKKIIENELYNQSRATGANEYTVEQYDEFLSKAKSVWERIRLLDKNDELSFHTYFYGFNTEERYIQEVQQQKQNKIERMARESKNNKAKKVLIPKYKNWKNTTVPKFQKSLKAGDYVAGGIVWKVNGSLVVVDTGNRGLVSQRRDQTYPRVPQDLMPLFMDEITGVARY